MVKKICDDEKITKVFHNALYDLGWLRTEGIEVKGKIIDTMIAAPLLDENRRYYNLNSLAGDYLGTYKDEKMLKSAQKNLVLILNLVCGNCLLDMLASMLNKML